MEKSQLSEPGCSSPPAENYLIKLLPFELIEGILAYLSPLDLAAVSRTSRELYIHATTEWLWKAHVQANVPGYTLSTPHPCTSFKELYAAHDPHWFLSRYKLWFSGRDLNGKMMMVRYDEKSGCIEGFQALAVSKRTTFQQWPPDPDVVFKDFEPQVKMHMDRPLLRLHVRSREECAQHLSWEDEGLGGSSSKDPPLNRLAAATPMVLDKSYANAIFSNFLLARPLPHTGLPEDQLPFPYRNMWPPPTIPAPHRVATSNFVLSRVGLKPAGRPHCRADISNTCFHIHTFMVMGRTPHLSQPLSQPRFNPLNVSYNHYLFPPPLTAAVDDDSDAHLPAQYGNLNRLSQNGLPWLENLHLDPTIWSVGTRMGEEVATYATLDPKLYTPTADKPWRGIWVGDYSVHGCEFLLVHQPDDAEPFDEGALLREPGESEEAFKRKVRDARVYRGRLEAIKLTGDENVPRGECTFVAEDLGPAGFVMVAAEAPFAGTRVVASKGHIAPIAGFLEDRYIDSHLLLISHDRLAQLWLGHGHISFFQRVDIDQFLTP